MRFVCRIEKMQLDLRGRSLTGYISFAEIFICLVDGGVDTHEEHAFTGEAEVDVTDEGKEDLEPVLSCF